ncbi:MAG: glycosyltransferase family 2 protein, partial [Marmoricola sp.]
AAPIVIELGYACFLQACFVVSIIQIATGRKAGWNDVPRPATNRAVGPALLVPAATAYGILLPTSLLDSDWYQALTVWVGFNTLVFASLSLLQVLPPLRRGARQRSTA